MCFSIWLKVIVKSIASSEWALPSCFLAGNLKVDLNLSVKACLKILFFQLHTLRMIPRFTKILSRQLSAGPVSSRGPLEENQLLVVKTMKDWCAAHLFVFHRGRASSFCGRRRGHRLTVRRIKAFQQSDC